MESFEPFDVLILCGGFGTRLRPVFNDRPKGLVPVGEKLFLEILVEQLLAFGFQRFIFCVGHFKEQIIQHFQHQNDGQFLFSEEEVPLGTGGAVKNAESLLQGERFLILNGDSWCEIDFSDFLQFHQEKEALLSMALSPSNDAQDYGTVAIDHKQRLLSFQEKLAKQGKRWINAGVYLLEQEGFALMPKKPAFSLETEVFPKLVETRRCFGFTIASEVFDIGTPERYQKANRMFSK